jgi:hypothetical protein
MVERTEKWITALMDGPDKNVDEKTIAKILEQCGRQCQSQSFIKKARAIYQKSKNTDVSPKNHRYTRSLRTPMIFWRNWGESTNICTWKAVKSTWFILSVTVPR